MAVTRDDVVRELEDAVWIASGWKIRTAAVDKLMSVVDQYAAGQAEQRAAVCPPAAPDPVPAASTPPEPSKAPAERTAPVLEASKPVKPKPVPRQRAKKIARRVLPSSEPQRLCRDCQRLKPADAFRFAARSQTRRRLECRACEGVAREDRRTRKAQEAGS